jgi:hypothetical protein
MSYRGKRVEGDRPSGRWSCGIGRKGKEIL